METPAKNVEGVLLYNPFENKYFFRIYHDKKVDENIRENTDYKLCAEDIRITITDKYTSLYENEEGKENKLEYSSNVLGKGSKRLNS